MRRYHDAGFEQIKIYSSIADSVLRAITAEAHALGMTVTGHIPRGMDGYQGVAAGMDQINHISFIHQMMRARGDTTPLTMDMPEAQKAIAFLVEHHIVVDPTIALYELNAHPADQPVSAFEPGVDKVAPELRQALTHTGAAPADAAKAPGAVPDACSRSSAPCTGPASPSWPAPTSPCRATACTARWSSTSRPDSPPWRRSRRRPSFPPAPWGWTRKAARSSPACVPISWS